jgi:hypothetical protein
MSYINASFAFLAAEERNFQKKFSEFYKTTDLGKHTTTAIRRGYPLVSKIHTLELPGMTRRCRQYS